MNDIVPICPTHDVFFECPECSNKELQTQLEQLQTRVEELKAALVNMDTGAKVVC
jgi:hypothetical protein